MLGPAAQVASESPQWGAPLTPWDTLLRILAVLALLALLSVLARRWGAGVVPRVGAAGAMQVLATLALGPQKALYLIRVGRRIIVVGVTGRSMELLLELDPQDWEELGIQDLHRQGQGDRFARWLQRFSRHPEAGAGAGESRGPEPPEGEGRH